MPRSPSPHDGAPGRTTSLLSRIKAPFGAKARNIAEFYVQPDDPHRQYSPGDVITGSVILKVVKPLRVTHITACLHGFVQVYKAPNNPGQSYREYTGTSTPGKTARTGYFGNGFVSLFQDEVMLCGEGRLAEGMYQFGYELMFPKDRLPSSIDVRLGPSTVRLFSCSEDTDRSCNSLNEARYRTWSRQR
jgi:arrestin-related trafficking adapter 9